MTQSVAVVENECCGSCSAVGEVLKINQRQTPTIGTQVFICVPDFRRLSLEAERVISEYAMAKHFPEAKR